MNPLEDTVVIKLSHLVASEVTAELDKDQVISSYHLLPHICLGSILESQTDDFKVDDMVLALFRSDEAKSVTLRRDHQYENPKTIADWNCLKAQRALTIKVDPSQVKGEQLHLLLCAVAHCLHVYENFYFTHPLTNEKNKQALVLGHSSL